MYIHSGAYSPYMLLMQSIRHISEDLYVHISHTEIHTAPLLGKTHTYTLSIMAIHYNEHVYTHIYDIPTICTNKHLYTVEPLYKDTLN